MLFRKYSKAQAHSYLQPPCKVGQRKVYIIAWSISIGRRPYGHGHHFFYLPLLWLPEMPLKILLLRDRVPEEQDLKGGVVWAATGRLRQKGISLHGSTSF